MVSWSVGGLSVDELRTMLGDGDMAAGYRAFDVVAMGAVAIW